MIGWCTQGTVPFTTMHRHFIPYFVINRSWVALFVLWCAGVTTVKVPCVRAQTPTVRRVAPGDTSLRFSELTPDTAVYFLNAYRNGEEISIGTITDVLTRTSAKLPEWRRVLKVERGNTRLTDSTLSDGATLSPKRRYSWQPQRELRLEFNGLKVKGMLGPPDSPGVPLDTTLMVPAFDAGNWDLVLRAMPLGPDYEANFPVFDIETGTHLYGVRVVGSTTMMGETAHIVLFQLGGSREIKVWIGARTRRLLQTETPIDGTISLMQTLRAKQPPG